jgi:putative ABC transport system permease protein
MPMIPKLAYRNLFHDRLSLAVTLVGIVFSVVLVAVQFGIYLGSENRIAAMLDQAKGDLWVVALGTKSFDDPSLLSGRERHAVLSTPGVGSVEELAVGFVHWRKPKGGSTAALLVGSEITRGSACRGPSQGTAAAWLPSAVAIDGTCFGELGIKKLGDRAESTTWVTVNAVTASARSPRCLRFHHACDRSHTAGRSPDQSSYTLVNVAPGASIQTVQAAWQPAAGREILTHAEFRKRGLDTGCSRREPARPSSPVLGIIGIVIVARRSMPAPGPPEQFATLRAAPGASAGYINKVS